MSIVMSAKKFKDQIYKTQGFVINFPANVEQVYVKNESILTHRVPDNWTVDQFKKYCNKFVKLYLYKEKSEEEIIKELQDKINPDGASDKPIKTKKRKTKQFSILSDDHLDL